MTTLFYDIYTNDTHLLPHRIFGSIFYEIINADDTICATVDTRAMKKFLTNVEEEEEGAKYGLKLSKNM